jgi:putative MATE family efflux protein
MRDADARPGLWSTVREAVRGTEQDLTAIPIGRAIVLLAVPTVLEMSMESLLTIVDIFFVSKLGSDAVATVGLTEAMLSPVYALAMGISAAATAIVARHTGAKEPGRAATAAVQVILLATSLAVLVGIVGLLVAPHLLQVMGASASIVKLGSPYTAVMLGGSITIFLLFVINAVFRSAGDAAIAMRSLWLANILNMMLAPCLVFGVGPFPRMGVMGAAVAMTASRGVGVLYQLTRLAGARGRLVILRRHIVVHAGVLREVVKLATPATGQVLVETASWLALVRIVASFGGTAVAGYTIAMRIAIFALLPSWGLAMAASTLVGQNLGAKEPERARRAVWTVAKYNVLFLGPVGLAFALAPNVLVSFFTNEPATAMQAAECLRIVALGFIVFAFGMVAVQAFNGAGDTTTPMLVNLASFWFFKIPLAWVLAKVFDMGPRGAFLAITAAYAVQSITAMTLFRRGKWAERTGDA